MGPLGFVVGSLRLEPTFEPRIDGDLSTTLFSFGERGVLWSASVVRCLLGR